MSPTILTVVIFIGGGVYLLLGYLIASVGGDDMWESSGVRQSGEAKVLLTVAWLPIFCIVLLLAPLYGVVLVGRRIAHYRIQLTIPHRDKKR